MMVTADKYFVSARCLGAVGVIDVLNKSDITIAGSRVREFISRDDSHVDFQYICRAVAEPVKRSIMYNSC